jgi:hypothetical protein
MFRLTSSIHTRLPYLLPGIIFLLTSHMQVRAQEFSVQQVLDTNIIQLGEQARLEIGLQYRQDYQVQLPALRDSLPKGIELLAVTLEDSIVKDNQVRIRYLIHITSFDSGMYLIPALNYIFSSKGKTDTLRTVPLGLQVEKPPVDPSKEIFDIKPPLKAPFTIQEIIFWSGLVILSLMVITITVLIIRRLRRKQPGLSSTKPSEPADVIALRELDQLKEMKLWQQGKTKEYYTRLTEIVRLYIENRFSVPALEQTSNEILHSLHFTALEDESTFLALKQLLELADLVKFAKALPLPDENEGNMLNAYVFVNRTRLQSSANQTVHEVIPTNVNEK